MALLHTARQALLSVGAEPFASRVESDLKRAGARSTRRSARSSLELTDREQDVAVLVAKGYSNPEAAAELYVSRKAIEYHLQNIYGKLGIASRRELRGLDPSSRSLLVCVAVDIPSLGLACGPQFQFNGLIKEAVIRQK